MQRREEYIMIGSKSTRLAAAAAVLLICAASAQATVITGNLWKVPESVALSAVPANVPGTTPDIIFDVDSPINFNAPGATVGTWLGSGSAFNIVENTAGILTSLMDNGTTGTILEFVGNVSVTNGQLFTVTHDDGLTLIIGGLDLGFNPAPTAPTTSTAMYTGPTGTFGFQLVYAECCGGDAVLQVDLPLTNVPEPGTLPLVGIGLAGLGFVARRNS